MKALVPVSPVNTGIIDVEAIPVVEYWEIAAALGQTKNAIEKRAQREGWPAQNRAVRGGQKAFFVIADLPADVQRAVTRLRAKSAAPAPVPVPAKAPLPLSDYQRRIDAARRAILTEIDKLAADTSLNKAVDAVCHLAARSELHPDLQALVPVANARSGDGSRTLTRITIMRWRAQLRDQGHCAPRHEPTRTVAPEWAAAFRKEYNIPSNPSIVDAHAEMELPPGIQRPSVHQVRRWLASLPEIERERGRRSPQALRAIKGYVKRSFDHLEPMDVCVCDGYTAKWYVAHPIHGQRFRPEITRILDVATRRTVGWSIGLAESTWAVLDAWAHAIRHHGLIAIPYTDNGSGEIGKIMTDQVVGFFGRLDVAHETGRPGNPQGRGVIERAWTRTFQDAAKRMISFAGPDMDSDAAKLIIKRIDRDLKVHGSSRHLPSWEDHKAWVAACIARDNDTPHRALPKFVDPVDGKRRHMTPNECWESFVAKGWQPSMPSPTQLEGLFRPHVIGNVRREIIRFNNVDYHHRDLADHHGRKVQVGFDIHDPTHIWVRDLDGRFICRATKDGHAQPYFDKIKLDRAKGRRTRILQKLNEVEAELGGSMIEAEALPLPAAIIEAATPDVPAPAPPPPPPPPPASIVHLSAPAAETEARPVFTSDLEMYVWCITNPAQATARDWDYLRRTAEAEPRLARLIADYNRRNGVTDTPLTAPEQAVG